MDTPTPPFLPYGRQLVEDDDVDAVERVLRGDQLTTGPEVDAFERDFAAAVGARHAAACANGTAALHLAAMALGIRPGDRVVVPAMTFLATASAPHLEGAAITFADCDAESGLVTPETLDAALRRAGGPVKAAFVVHLNGQACDMPALSEVATTHGCALVEDACHAVGGAYAANGKHCVVGGCDHSGMATFSFHPVKTIACGEGGMVTTNDDVFAERLQRMRNHGMVREAVDFAVPEQAFDAAGVANPWYYEMPEPGLNYRLSDIHAALGRSQLAKLDRFVAARAQLVARYDEQLAPLAPTVRPITRRAGTEPAWHLYPMLIDFEAAGVARSEVMRALAARGVGTQVHYIPVHRQPYWRRTAPGQELPGADRYYARVLSLPLFAAMEPADVDRVAAALGDTMDELGAKA